MVPGSPGTRLEPQHRPGMCWHRLLLGTRYFWLRSGRCMEPGAFAPGPVAHLGPGRLGSCGGWGVKVGGRQVSGGSRAEVEPLWAGQLPGDPRPSLPYISDNIPFIGKYNQIDTSSHKRICTGLSEASRRAQLGHHRFARKQNGSCVPIAGDRQTHPVPATSSLCSAVARARPLTGDLQCGLCLHSTAVESQGACSRWLAPPVSESPRCHGSLSTPICTTV